MPAIEKLRVFLASPSDVSNERKYARKVIDDINQTVAEDKGFFLDLVNSERAFPGYGKDGQAIINEQIAQMETFDLFIGIMWNRIGTPTPRAISGTVEEFERAVAVQKRKGKPDVWFYFREAPSIATSPEYLDQQREVMKFKTRLRRKGLLKQYKRPMDFREQLHKHLILWLNERSRASDILSNPQCLQHDHGELDTYPAAALGIAAHAATALPASGVDLRGLPSQDREYRREHSHP